AAELVPDDAGLGEGEGLGQPQHVGVETAGEQRVADREHDVVDSQDLHARHYVPGLISGPSLTRPGARCVTIGPWQPAVPRPTSGATTAATTTGSSPGSPAGSPNTSGCRPW